VLSNFNKRFYKQNIGVIPTCK